MGRKSGTKNTSKLYSATDEVKVEKPKVELPYVTFGIVPKNADGVYRLVKIKFDPDTSESKLVEVRDVGDDMGLAEERFRIAFIEEGGFE